MLDSFFKSTNAHVSPHLAKLHWLQIAHRIDCKISSLCSDFVSDTAQLYLSNLLRLYIPSSDSVYCIPLLTPVSFGFPNERKSSKGSMLSAILALSLGINSPALYTMLKQSLFKTQLKISL